MKHFVTTIQNDTTCSCFAYDDRTSAMAKFHHEMEYACSAGITTLCIVANSSGSIVASEKYTAPQPEQPEEEVSEEQ
ncbi:MAG: hypothetical protein IKI58_04155 [Oscillospiraceae bacterium]|nr:hypothetical protein [Oscillospiraceae bacterium]